MGELTLLILVGLPRSGKTTFAHWLSEKTNSPIVCPDSVRKAIHGKGFDKNFEWLVWGMMPAMIKSLFISGHRSVIIDACNVSRKRRDEWTWKLGEEYAKEFFYFDTPVNECKDRAIKYNQLELVDAIDRMNGNMEDIEREEGNGIYKVTTDEVYYDGKDYAFNIEIIKQGKMSDLADGFDSLIVHK